VTVSIPLNTVTPPPVVLDIIYRLKIKDAMTRELITAARSQSLRSIQALMKERGITGVPITEGKRIIGLVSMDDIIQALDGGHIEQAAEGHMSRNLIMLEDDMPLFFAISYSEKYRYGRYPVLNKDRELVGIITSRDILNTLLVEINKELEKLEQKTVAPPVSDGNITRLEFSVRRLDFEIAGKASTEIKKSLIARDVEPKLIRRIAVASYELEMNQVVHSHGGKIIFTVDAEKAEVTAVDSGPGIADVDQALEEGWSTANEWVRSLGFGAGMGLPNARRVSDEFSISSEVGKGTSVRSIVYFKGKP
jgi:CBS domain-containing protein